MVYSSSREKGLEFVLSKRTRMTLKIAAAVLGIVFLPLIIYGLAAMPRQDYSTMNGESTLMAGEVEELYSKKLSKLEASTNELAINDKYQDPGLFFIEYTVEKGDNPTLIANKIGLNVDTVVSVNKQLEDNPHFIRYGRKIRLPNRNGVMHSVKKGESLSDISQKYFVDEESIKDVNLIDGELKEGRELFVPGVRFSKEDRAEKLGLVFAKPLAYSRITSPFGYRRDPFTRAKRFHYGVDLAYYYGAAIYAVGDGRVSYAGRYGGYGNCVMIKHRGKYKSLYAHMKTINVRRGQFVRQGQVIGRLGNTGRSKGPHLHFEIREYGHHINPLSITSLK